MFGSAHVICVEQHHSNVSFSFITALLEVLYLVDIGYAIHQERLLHYSIVHASTCIRSSKYTAQKI